MPVESAPTPKTKTKMMISINIVDFFLPFRALVAAQVASQNSGPQHCALEIRV
jgi:hypothetical protein